MTGTPLTGLVRLRIVVIGGNNPPRQPVPGTACAPASTRIMTITHEKQPLRQARRLRLSLSVVATDLATEHGGTDANKRDAVRQGGRLNLADVQL